jgi:hypothetical protein
MKCYICGGDAPELYPSIVPDHWECERCLKRRLEDKRRWGSLADRTRRLIDVSDPRKHWPPAGVYAYAAPFPHWEEP